MTLVSYARIIIWIHKKMSIELNFANVVREFQHGIEAGQKNLNLFDEIVSEAFISE